MRIKRLVYDNGQFLNLREENHNYREISTTPLVANYTVLQNHSDVNYVPTWNVSDFKDLNLCLICLNSTITMPNNNPGYKC
jgi:hypothetical protein